MHTVARTRKQNVAKITVTTHQVRVVASDELERFPEGDDGGGLDAQIKKKRALRFFERVPFPNILADAPARGDTGDRQRRMSRADSTSGTFTVDGHTRATTLDSSSIVQSNDISSHQQPRQPHQQPGNQGSHRPRSADVRVLGRTIHPMSRPKTMSNARLREDPDREAEAEEEGEAKDASDIKPSAASATPYIHHTHRPTRSDDHLRTRSSFSFRSEYTDARETLFSPDPQPLSGDEMDDAVEQRRGGSGAPSRQIHPQSPQRSASTSDKRMMLLEEMELHAISGSARDEFDRAGGRADGRRPCTSQDTFATIQANAVDHPAQEEGT